MAKSDKTQSKILSKIEAIKQIKSNPTQSVDSAYNLIKKDLPSQNGMIRRKIDDFSDKKKAKKTQVSNVLENLLKTVESFLGDNKNSKDKPAVQKKLIRYAKDSASNTLKSGKQIVLDAVQNKLFAGEGVCGSNNSMPVDTMSISPKEFDFLDMLKIDPASTTGGIMYETEVDKGFVKMNREFYGAFNNPSGYTFTNNNGDTLFKMNWDEPTQKYIISELTGTTGLTVSNFIGNYYNRIEQVDTENVLKQAMLMCIQGDGSEPESYVIKMDWLNRLLDKLFSICGKSQTDNPLNQNAANQIVEDEIDLEWYFDFDDTEGIDVDEEDARHRRVLKFKDCDNFEIPIDKSHIEDFVYFYNQNNIEDTITNTINNIAAEASEESGQRFSINDLEVSLNFKYILNAAKALVAGIISPKIFFPIVVVYKSIKAQNLNASDILKELKNLFYEIIKNIFWKFLQNLWSFIKKDLLNFLVDTAKTILMNKLKRYKTILTSLLDLLTDLLNNIPKSCEDLFGTILSVIQSAISSKTKLPIPGLLLSLSDQLPGYSSDRAYMNITERLTAAGVDMEPIYGKTNQTHALVKSIVDGNSEEMDTNSYVKIALKPTIAVSGPGGTVITPLIGGVGKIF